MFRRLMQSFSDAFRPDTRLLLTIFLASFFFVIGCRKPLSQVQQIQRKRDEQQRNATEVDHLRDAYGFIGNLAELNADAANQRITSLLNAWLDLNPMRGQWDRPKIISTLELEGGSFDPFPNLNEDRFITSDVEHLKLAYLLKQVTGWIDADASMDPLFESWLESKSSELGEQNTEVLRRAVQLFDWTIRNIQLEPLVATDPAPPAPELPAGLEFRGAGYRQTTSQTLFRGVGDQWQRARVFIQLCRQAKVDACVLGKIEGNGQKVEEWTVGVLVGEDVYLFDSGLGMPIPGPNQEGIATLEEARNDPSVLRRLTVQGWFDYPFDNEMVQQTVALLDLTPQWLARRMRHLEEGLVGETRMVLWNDADAVAKRFDDVSGIAGARMWKVPVQAQLYEQVMAQVARDVQQFAFWESARWGMLGDKLPLSRARWDHLKGQFERLEQEPGARVRYMEMRHPEFDIDGLERNVALQKEYGVRRTLGQSPEEYQYMIQSVQVFMRMSKRAASYWISLIHYDKGDFENAKNWYQKRVLDEEQVSQWVPSARYNLGRTLEQLGETEQALEIYKTIGDPQEHGNRLRARLLEKAISK